MWWVTLSWGNPALWVGCVDAEHLPVLGAAEATEAVEQSYLDPKGAESRLTALIERYPACGALRMARASTRHAQGLSSAAEEDLRLAQELGEGSALRALALHLHDRGGAGRILDEAVRAHPADAFLKILQADEQPVSERSALLVTALAAHPNNSEVANAMVEAIAEAGRPWEAIDAGKEWLANHSDSVVEARIRALEQPFIEEERFRPTPGEFRLLEDGTEEVVVYSPVRARRELELRLFELGWTEVRDVPGGVRYRSDVPVQPYVEILDGGEVVVQSRGWVKPRKLPDPTQLMIPVISARKLRRKRARMMEDIAPQVWRWQNAIARESFASRLDQTLPDQLSALWEQGVPFYGDTVLDGLRARRDQMIEQWVSRACTPEGDAVREVIGRFVENIVQESPVALDAPAIQAIEHRTECEGRHLVSIGLAKPVE